MIAFIVYGPKIVLMLLTDLKKPAIAGSIKN